MAKTILKHREKKISTGPYSAGVECDGWVYVSGHASQDLKTGESLAGTIKEETARTLEHIGKVLKEAGCGFEDIVKCTCHLAHIEDFQAFNEVYARFFPHDPPARTTVQSVLWGNLKVEIDAVARVPSGRH